MARKPKTLHIVAFKFAGAGNKWAAEVFTAKRRANRCMDGSQYGVIARRVQVEVPLT
jgi:hypothetical protein